MATKFMNLDTQLFYWLHGLDGKNAILDQIIVFFGDYFIWVVILAFVCSVYYHYRKNNGEKKYFPLFALLSAIFANMLIADLIKEVSHISRPYLVLPIHHLLTDNSYAFPSGHTTFMFALATGVYAYDKKFAVALYIFGLLIGVARVMGGVHWPSDILGGALIRFVTVWLIKKFCFHKAQKLINSYSL